VTAGASKTAEPNTSARVAPGRVAFQGEHGAFSEEAAIELFGPDVKLVPCPTFDALFEYGDADLVDYLLVPVENSLIGSIKTAVDLVSARSFAAVKEVRLRIHQYLIGCSGARFEGIETVESHPAALDQCRRFFAEHPRVKRIEAEDTAGSVRRIVEIGDHKRAAIAGRRAAEIYGGSILKENLEDEAENYTRFVLLRIASNGRAEVETS